MEAPQQPKNPQAVALGRRRMSKMTKKERAALARKAATARWDKRGKDG